MNSSQQKTIQIYQNLMVSNSTVHAFRTAQRLGIFEELMNGQRTAEEIAESRKLTIRPTQLLLDYLMETGFVEKYGEDYALSVLGKMLPEAFLDLGDRYWKELESWVRTGERTCDEQEQIELTSYGVEQSALEWMGTPNAMDLIEILNIGKSRIGMRVIELGCGSAILGSALGYHDQQMKLTFVDHGKALERAKQTVESVQIRERCQFVEADPVHFQPKFEADLVVVPNLCRLLDDASVGLLFRNVAKSLNKDGEIALIDQFSESDSARLANRSNAIETEMRTPKGKFRTGKEYTELLYANGFCDAMYSDLKSPPRTHGVIVAGISNR